MKTILVACVLLISGITHAGASTGKIASIYVGDNSPAVLFDLTSPIDDTPRCNEDNKFSLSLLKTSGKTAFTALLEAKHKEFTVTVSGLNTGSNHWKSEDIKNIKIH